MFAKIVELLMLMRHFMIVLYLCFPLFAHTKDDCPNPYVGVNCTLRCFCQSDDCDEAGYCRSSSDCVAEKFGPLCQYERVQIDTAPSWLNDNIMSTCNPDREQLSMTLEIQTTFTWARMIVHDNEHREISLSFDGDSLCPNMRSFFISKGTVDVHCNFQKPVNEIHLKGSAVGYLCELYISGGRNVALRQEVHLSSKYGETAEEGAAKWGVDGEKEPSKNHGCVHASLTDPLPQFSVIFKRPHRLHTVILYPRAGRYAHRMKDFKISFYDTHGTLLLDYQEQSHMARDIFIAHIGIVEPVVKVNLTTSGESPNILHFCELELYGDIICGNSSFGPACEYKCDFCLENGCHVETGACTGHCPPGKQYLGCNIDCERGTYGIHCERKCPQECGDNCDPETGECTYGSNQTLQFQSSLPPPMKCLDGYYGQACALPCSDQCENRQCHPSSGRCYSCAPGYHGEHCSMISECNTTFYGPNCSQQCSEVCEQRHCHPYSGVCLACIAGYRGQNCTEVISSTQKGKASLIIYSPFLFGAVFIVICMMRRKRTVDDIVMDEENPRREYGRNTFGRYKKSEDEGEDEDDDYDFDDDDDDNDDDDNEDE